MFIEYPRIRVYDARFLAYSYGTVVSNSFLERKNALTELCKRKLEEAFRSKKLAADFAKCNNTSFELEVVVDENYRKRGEYVLKITFNSKEAAAVFARHCGNATVHVDEVSNQSYVIMGAERAKKFFNDKLGISILDLFSKNKFDYERDFYKPYKRPAHIIEIPDVNKYNPVIEYIPFSQKNDPYAWFAHTFLVYNTTREENQDKIDLLCPFQVLLNGELIPVHAVEALYQTAKGWSTEMEEAEMSQALKDFEQAFVTSVQSNPGLLERGAGSLLREMGSGKPHGSGHTVEAFRDPEHHHNLYYDTEDNVTGRSIKEAVMADADTIRITQDLAFLMSLLYGTEGKLLVEESRTDKFWGAKIESNQLKGDNVAGYSLMEIRQKLREELENPNGQGIRVRVSLESLQKYYPHMNPQQLDVYITPQMVKELLDNENIRNLLRNPTPANYAAARRDQAVMAMQTGLMDQIKTELANQVNNEPQNLDQSSIVGNPNSFFSRPSDNPPVDNPDDNKPSIVPTSTPTPTPRGRFG